MASGFFKGFLQGAATRQSELIQGEKKAKAAQAKRIQDQLDMAAEYRFKKEVDLTAENADIEFKKEKQLAQESLYDEEKAKLDSGDIDYAQFTKNLRTKGFTDEGIGISNKNRSLIDPGFEKKIIDNEIEILREGGASEEELTAYRVQRFKKTRDIATSSGQTINVNTGKVEPSNKNESDLQLQIDNGIAFVELAQDTIKDINFGTVGLLGKVRQKLGPLGDMQQAIFQKQIISLGLIPDNEEAAEIASVQFKMARLLELGLSTLSAETTRFSDNEAARIMKLLSATQEGIPDSRATATALVEATKHIFKKTASRVSILANKDMLSGQSTQTIKWLKQKAVESDFELITLNRDAKEDTDAMFLGNFQTLKEKRIKAINSNPEKVKRRDNLIRRAKSGEITVEEFNIEMDKLAKE